MSLKINQIHSKNYCVYDTFRAELGMLLALVVGSCFCSLLLRVLVGDGVLDPRLFSWLSSFLRYHCPTSACFSGETALTFEFWKMCEIKIDDDDDDDNSDDNDKGIIGFLVRKD